MKKLFAIFIAVLALSGCAKKESHDYEEISATHQETLQPDPLYVTTTALHTIIKTTNNTHLSGTATATTTAVAAETTAAVTDAPAAPEEELQPDPLGAGAFTYDNDGAVQFVQDIESSDDRTLISAGQALFESACRTEWNFTVGCPYSLDLNSTVNNGLGWTYYRITDPSVKNLSDVESDYYNIFSDRYPHDDLSMLYLEYEGSVYALNGQRDMNYYYSISRITGITSRTGDEIFFTVEHQYDGNDKNPDTPYSETETFSAVISPDGKWKAGKFRLPY